MANQGLAALDLKLSLATLRPRWQIKVSLRSTSRLVSLRFDPRVPRWPQGQVTSRWPCLDIVGAIQNSSKKFGPNPPKNRPKNERPRFWPRVTSEVTFDLIRSPILRGAEQLLFYDFFRLEASLGHFRQNWHMQVRTAKPEFSRGCHPLQNLARDLRKSLWEFGQDLTRGSWDIVSQTNTRNDCFIYTDYRPFYYKLRHRYRRLVTRFNALMSSIFDIGQSIDNESQYFTPSPLFSERDNTGTYR